MSLQIFVSNSIKKKEHKTVLENILRGKGNNNNKLLTMKAEWPKKIICLLIRFKVLMVHFILTNLGTNLTFVYNFFFTLGMQLNSQMIS